MPLWWQKIYTLDWLSPAEKMSILTLVQAERLAKRRYLKLVPHDDDIILTKGGRPVYKLITSKEYTGEAYWTKKEKKHSSYIKV